MVRRMRRDVIHNEEMHPAMKYVPQEKASPPAAFFGGSLLLTELKRPLAITVGGGATI